MLNLLNWEHKDPTPLNLLSTAKRDGALQTGKPSQTRIPQWLRDFASPFAGVGTLLTTLFFCCHLKNGSLQHARPRAGDLKPAKAWAFVCANKTSFFGGEGPAGNTRWRLATGWPESCPSCLLEWKASASARTTSDGILHGFISFCFRVPFFWFDHFYAHGPTLSIQEEPFRHDLREPLVELLEDSDEWMDAEMRAVVYYLRGNRHLNLPPWMRELFAKYSP